MHDMDWQWRGLVVCEDAPQGAGGNMLSDLIGKCACQPDTADRRIDRRFAGIDDEPRRYRHCEAFVVAMKGPTLGNR